MRPTVLDRDRAYAEWAASYPPRAHNPLMEVEESAVLAMLPPLAGLRALDAGCGSGRYVRLLKERGARHVVGLDRSESMLTHAKGFAAGLVRGDLTRLPLCDESVDVIVSGLAVPDVPDLQIVVNEWRRVLKPNGRAVYSTLHPSGAARGWARTFETRRGRYELPAHWHTPEDHRSACERAGLRIEAIAEPTLGDNNPVAFVVCAIRAM